jgi:UDP-N-acetylenolpyruvoylglucosamine reductase
MGFAANQARLLALISRKSDLELEAQFISQHRMYLANAMSVFFNMQAKLEPGSEAAKILDARIKQLQQADKVLEMHLNRITSQRDAVGKELTSVKQVIRQNIQQSFGLLGGG